MPPRIELAQSHLALFQKAFLNDDFDGACFMWWEYLIGAEWQDGPPVSRDRTISDELICVNRRILSA